MPQLLAGLTTTLTFALWCFAFTIAIQTSQPVFEETPVLELNRNLQDWHTMDFTIHGLSNKHRSEMLD